ncbi:MAG: aminopeptidase, partial [Novosphingobium sp. 35-62-5]
MTDRNALIQPDRGQQAIDLHLVDKATLPDFLKSLNGAQRSALAAQKFEGGGYEHAIVPEGDGWFAVAGVANVDDLSSWCMAKLADVLPGGTYRRAGAEPGKALHGWVTGQYRFDRYRKDTKDAEPRILLTKDVALI